MPIRIGAPQFRPEHGESSAYPFADGSTRTSTSGLVIPPSALLDVSLYPVGATHDLALTGIDWYESDTGAFMELQFGRPGRPWLCRGSVHVDLVGGPTIAVRDRYQRPAGVFIIDDAAIYDLLAWPKEPHTFAAGATPLAARCVIPSVVNSVTSLIAGGLARQGVVALTCGDGVLIRIDPDSVGEGGATIVRLDAVGDPLARRRRCEAADSELDLPWPLRALILEDRNGAETRIVPDASGAIALVPIARTHPDPALRVDAEGHRLVLSAPGQAPRSV